MVNSSLLLFLSLVSLSLAIPQSFYSLTPRNENGGRNWALLVAGSNTWGNYRHQADICHAYQVLKSNGFVDSQIVVMMYDDIAHNSQNPTPGKVINKPGGVDVYTGVPHDYTGTQVNAQNFYQILQGIPTGTGSGKVINSGSNDNIFLFYSDHGSVGFICMPYGAYVYADDLSVTLKTMASERKFNKFLIYIEACESGSMFYNGYLPTNISIFATTAANPYESSYACYYDPTRGTYLGDCYSVNWMEYTDSIDISVVSVEQEFEEVRSSTTQSHVCAYGDTKLSSDMLSVYMKGSNSSYAIIPKKSFIPPSDYVDQRTVEEGILKNRYQNTDSPSEKAAIALEMEKLQEQRKEVHSLYLRYSGEVLHNKYTHKLPEFKKMVLQIMDPKERSQLPEPKAACDLNVIGEMVFRNFACYKRVNEYVRKVCGPMDSYSLQFTPLFASLCELTDNDYNTLESAAKFVCPTPFWN